MYVIEIHGKLSLVGVNVRFELISDGLSYQKLHAMLSILNIVYQVIVSCKACWVIWISSSCYSY